MNNARVATALRILREEFGASDPRLSKFIASLEQSRPITAAGAWDSLERAWSGKDLEEEGKPEPTPLELESQQQN